MFKARTTTALLLTIPALALGACGGSDSDDSNSDEDQITAVVEAVAADPVAICDHVTAADLREIGGKDACVRMGEASEDRGSEATINDISVDGDSATVRLTDDDGPTTVRFAKEDGDWKILPG